MSTIASAPGIIASPVGRMLGGGDGGVITRMIVASLLERTTGTGRGGSPMAIGSRFLVGQVRAVVRFSAAAARRRRLQVVVVMPAPDGPARRARWPGPRSRNCWQLTSCNVRVIQAGARRQGGLDDDDLADSDRARSCRPRPGFPAAAPRRAAEFFRLPSVGTSPTCRGVSGSGARMVLSPCSTAGR